MVKGKIDYLEQVRFFYGQNRYGILFQMFRDESIKRKQKLKLAQACFYSNFPQTDYTYKNLIIQIGDIVAGIDA
jgi:hypothetical protein